MKREAVALALHEIEGVQGASFSDVIGFGRGKADSAGYSPSADPSGYVKHVKVEVVCDDSLADKVIHAIHRSAHTGLRGDGHIFVTDIEHKIRIQEAFE